MGLAVATEAPGVSNREVRNQVPRDNGRFRGGSEIASDNLGCNLGLSQGDRALKLSSALIRGGTTKPTVARGAPHCSDFPEIAPH